MRSPRRLLPVATAALLAACGGDDLEPCEPTAEKAALAAIVYGWYLYPDLLPPAVDTARYATAAELLDAMTAGARAAGQDRGWSFVTTTTAAESYFEAGTSVGLGLGLLVRDARILVSQVYPGSAAAEQGFARGDELLRIGETADALVVVTPENLGALLGPSTAGVTRTLEVRTAGTPAVTRTVTVTKRSFGLDPVPVVDGTSQRWRIHERADGTRAGYVALRTFVATADAQLTEAFQAFADAGVEDVVVDLRYNGGGLLRTGELLANLLGGGLAGQTMLRVAYSPLRAGDDELGRFAPPAAALSPRRVAFITTGASASASELVPNVLEPHREMALVGARTYGKPVGQTPFALGACASVAYLVSFRLENSQGDGAFFDGLPDAAGRFGDPFCAAEDDLLHAPGDPEEASTGAALAWVASGTCPAPAVASSSKLSARAGTDAYPAAPDPTVAQRHVRGLF